MSQREFILNQLKKDCGFTQEMIDKADDLTSKLNSFFESELLVPHPGSGFQESFGYLRRGSKEDGEKIVSPRSFERDSWPSLSWGDHGVDGIIWVLMYEKAPEYESSGQIFFGYTFDRSSEEVRKRPFFSGQASIYAEERFASLDETTEFLRKYLAAVDYRKR